jgi:ASC-1-like (ASCH) protein
MTTHLMNLQPVFLERIRSGKKCIELRLFDEKRQLMALGDTLCFWHGEGVHRQEVSARIIGLVRYPSFKALIDDVPLEWLGTASLHEALREVSAYYSDADQQKYGVLGIRFEKI